MIVIARALIFASLLSSALVSAQDSKPPAYPAFDYDATRKHEIKPHRRTVPMDGLDSGFNQLHITLTVSSTGQVIDADATGEDNVLKFWPELEGEVSDWRFTPFEKDGKAVTAKIEEYIDLVPPEKPPTKHVTPPMLKPDSKAEIKLQRTGCFGSCPSYSVTVTTEGIVFEGRGTVVASGRHTSSVNADEVRQLAKKFISDDFYSMSPTYRAEVTDNPTYVLSISIDGNRKEIEDYVGAWVGMPQVVSELEEEVDSLAQTQRWINGEDGLVDALQAEKYNFKTFEAQVMLKEAATRGQTETVQDLLDAGVPLKLLPAPKPTKEYETIPFEHEGWLTAASDHQETLQALIDAEASKDDQTDKDLALLGAAESGNLAAVRALIAYGASPNADLSKTTSSHSRGVLTITNANPGNALISAASSGNPEMVRELLAYHPRLEARDSEGKTAIFAAAEYRGDVEDSARVECVRLLAEAGADVNARDQRGNSPLHETFLTPVEEELLKLGADVNARNNQGETPIFTTVDRKAIPLFAEHGADLTVRNKNGQNVLEAAAKYRGPDMTDALRKAMEKQNLNTETTADESDEAKPEKPDK